MSLRLNPFSFPQMLVSSKIFSLVVLSFGQRKKEHLGSSLQNRQILTHLLEKLLPKFSFIPVNFPLEIFFLPCLFVFSSVWLKEFCFSQVVWKTLGVSSIRSFFLQKFGFWGANRRKKMLRTAFCANFLLFPLYTFSKLNSTHLHLFAEEDSRLGKVIDTFKKLLFLVFTLHF